MTSTESGPIWRGCERDDATHRHSARRPRRARCGFGRFGNAPRHAPLRERSADFRRTAIGGALVLALVLLPSRAVRHWMPDVNGFMRPLLYLAANPVVIGACSLLAPGHTGKRHGWLAGRTVHLARPPDVRPLGVSIPVSRFARLRTGV